MIAIDSNGPRSVRYVHVTVHAACGLELPKLYTEMQMERTWRMHMSPVSLFKDAVEIRAAVLNDRCVVRKPRSEWLVVKQRHGLWPVRA
jgi:hypothetical protein